MTFLIREYSGIKLVYHQIPKNGCTTVANMINQADGKKMPANELTATGRDTVKSYYHTHMMNNVRKWNRPYRHVDCDISIVIKRDPIARFISGYTNRIHFHNDLGRDLPGTPIITPTITEFINHFDEYMKETWIRQHFQSQSWFAGKTKYHTHVYDLSQIKEFAKLLSDLSKKKINLVRLQQGGNTIPVELTSSQINWIRKKYEEDYDNGFC